jgi:exodeoxyribonuclease VII large subunit
MQIDQLQERLYNGVRVFIDKRNADLAKLAAELSHLSPLTILAKGYSVVYKGSGVVKSVKDVKRGDALKLRVFDGEIKAEVKS